MAIGTTANADTQPGDEDSKTGSGEGIPDLPTVGSPYCDIEGYPTYEWRNLGQYNATEAGGVIDEIGTSDGTPFFLQYMIAHWCTDINGKGAEKYDIFFISIVNPDTVAWAYDLYAKVKGLLKDPTVSWKDIDADHGWLWVNVEHHVGIDPVATVEEKQAAGNWMAGYATAWIKATPAELTIEIPDAPDLELAGCNLQAATDPDGCRIRFRHSSSITPDSVFHGTIRLRWDVTSNSGKYNGRIIKTESTFEITVAEAMAVSGG